MKTPIRYRQTLMVGHYVVADKTRSPQEKRQNCFRQGFYLALLRYADDLKSHPEVAAMRAAREKGLKKLTAKRKQDNAPAHKVTVGYKIVPSNSGDRARSIPLTNALLTSASPGVAHKMPLLQHVQNIIRNKTNQGLLVFVIVLLGFASFVTAQEPRGEEVLRIVVKEVEPFVFVEPTGCRGYSIDLWNEIAKQLNVRSEFDVKATVADMLRSLQENKADAAIAAITITAEREAVVDFTHAIYSSGLRIAIPSRIAPTWIATLSKFLSIDFLAMLGTLIFLTFLAANLLWFFERSVNAECFPKSYAAGLSEAVWWSIATIITGGCENKSPVSILGRLVAIAWMLGSIILVASFTATLSAQMTTEAITGTIAGPEGIPGRVIATLEGTNVVQSLKNRDARVVECASLEDAFLIVGSGRAEAVVFDNPMLAYTINQSNRSPVRLIGPLFEHQSYGIALPTGSPLRERINIAILALDESGVLQEINKKWFGSRE